MSSNQNCHCSCPDGPGPQRLKKIKTTNGFAYTTFGDCGYCERSKSLIQEHHRKILRRCAGEKSSATGQEKKIPDPLPADQPQSSNPQYSRCNFNLNNRNLGTYRVESHSIYSQNDKTFIKICFYNNEAAPIPPLQSINFLEIQLS